MDKRKDLDHIIKSTLDRNTNSIKASRNIFNEAWIRKDEKSMKNNHFNIRPIVRVAIVTVCLMTLAFTTMVVASPKAKSMAIEAYNSLRTIFVIEKVGDEYVAIEKPENVEYEFENLGGVTIDDMNRSHLEDILGFKIHFPKVAGEYYNCEPYPSARMTIYNVKLRDIENYRDKFLEAIEDEKIYSELSDFHMERSVSTQYADKEGKGFFFYIRKHTNKYFASNVKVTKEFNIEGINCKIIESTRAVYPRKTKGNWRFEDMTKEPERIIKLHYLVWDYDGVSYSITPAGTLTEEIEEEKARGFVKSYMKSLKEISN